MEVSSAALLHNTRVQRVSRRACCLSSRCSPLRVCCCCSYCSCDRVRGSVSLSAFRDRLPADGATGPPQRRGGGQQPSARMPAHCESGADAHTVRRRRTHQHQHWQRQATVHNRPAAHSTTARAAGTSSFTCVLSSLCCVTPASFVVQPSVHDLQCADPFASHLLPRVAARVPFASRVHDERVLGVESGGDSGAVARRASGV